MICPRKNCGGFIIQREDELVCLLCARIYVIPNNKPYLSDGEFESESPKAHIRSMPK